MNRFPDSGVQFADTMDSLASQQVWEYEAALHHQCSDVAAATSAALQQPLDFPPLSAAIVAGDRVVLAVDPNVPAIAEVVRGVIQSLAATEVADIDVVVWDEATDETVAAIGEQLAPAARVVRHLPSQRKSLCYLAADQAADPIYLNRLLVEADFVLPIVAGRPWDADQSDDLTGIYPILADSATRARHRDQQPATKPASEPDSQTAAESETPWLLGIQMIVCVTASVSGAVGSVTAGTVDAIRKQLAPARHQPDEFPPPAPLVIASLDGDRQQQTWSNAVRALAAAARYTLEGGTIVLWSAIDQPPPGRLLAAGNLELADSDPSDVGDDVGQRDAALADSDGAAVDESGDDFPRWDVSVGLANTLAQLAENYRLLIHSHLDDETIEMMGLAAVGDIAQLQRLSRSFTGCGVLRAAQFQSIRCQRMPPQSAS